MVAQVVSQNIENHLFALFALDNLVTQIMGV
jgi:hypothetical protein